jgi:hypothetical protein
MALRVNQTSLRKAKSFISQGKIDAASSWGFSAADGNKLLGSEGNDWENYSSFHLAEDTSAEENTKARYKYPWGKNDKIYRRGAIAAKARASAQGETAVAGAADSLLQAIDKKLGKEDTAIDEIKGEVIFNNLRIDYMGPDELDDYLEEPFQLTAEGYLKGRAIFTNIGVFPYKLEDGAVRWELRPPSEVFEYDSVNSFKLLPMTNDHPNGAVTVANIKEEQVGYTGEDIRTNAYYLSIPILVTDGESIDACQQKGKRALSAGYTADLEMTSGVWMGVPYDAIQRNIRGNHIAIVDRGRAGDDAVMKFDSADSVGILQTNISQAQNLNKRRNNSMSLKKIRIDEVDYEADQKIIDLYTDAKKELEQVKADIAAKIQSIDKISAERDQFKEEVGQLKKDKESAVKIQPDILEKAVQERLIVLDAASRAQIEVKSDMTEKDLKKEVVISVFPSSKEKLDNCSDDYLQSRFDGTLEALEALEKEKGADVLKGDTLQDVVVDPNKQKNDAEIARERMVENMRNASKRKEEVE